MNFKKIKDELDAMKFEYKKFYRHSGIVKMHDGKRWPCKKLIRMLKEGTFPNQKPQQPVMQTVPTNQLPPELKEILGEDQIFIINETGKVIEEDKIVIQKEEEPKKKRGRKSK